MSNEVSHVVLGATGGIGAALSRLLRSAGARVTVAGRDPEKVAALANEIGAHGTVVDARDPTAVEACLADAIARDGRVDGIACCVGSLLLKPAHLTSEEDWAATIATNLGSGFATVRAAGKLMARGGGSVVLVSSAAARHGLANHEAIAAAKAGLVGLALSAAATYAARGLRVNCVAPGLVHTPMTERLLATEAGRKASVAMHPLGRIGEPDDVARAIAWLLDPAQSWVTGQVLGVDGGLASIRPRAGG
ncbi:MAG: SDR family NAD(P)-dependent oxidoreductase [Alphaproteobacteria bacterium]